MICMPGDTSEYSITITGTVTKLFIRLFVNQLQVNHKDAYSVFDYTRAKINCGNQKITQQRISDVPDESTCSRGSCLG
jgi:hypothetical protein